MEDKDLPIVIDNGSHSMKAGFAGFDAPSLCFPTVIGHPTKFLRYFCRHESFVGNQAQIRRDSLTLQHPIEEGVIRNWDDLERIWSHIFAELNTPPQSRPVMLTGILNSKQNRKKMAEIMFEKFGVRALCSTHPALAVLFASGRTTGVVLHSGDGATQVVPIHDGIVLQHAVTDFEISGNSLSKHLINVFRKNNVNFKKVFERETVYGIKEKHCYVAYDFAEEMLAPSMPGKSYILPDGQRVTLGNERFCVPEALFHVSFASEVSHGADRSIKT